MVLLKVNCTKFLYPEHIVWCSKFDAEKNVSQCCSVSVPRRKGRSRLLEWIFLSHRNSFLSVIRLAHSEENVSETRPAYVCWRYARCDVVGPCKWTRFNHRTFPVPVNETIPFKRHLSSEDGDSHISKTFQYKTYTMQKSPAYRPGYGLNDWRLSK